MSCANSVRCGCAARQHSRADAGRAASAAADDAAAALLAVKADMSGGLADAGEGLGEGEAAGAGLAAAAEGLALLECEEALPSEEPTGALRGACGATLPSPQAKPKRQLGWKVCCLLLCLGPLCGDPRGNCRHVLNEG